MKKEKIIEEGEKLNINKEALENLYKESPKKAEDLINKTKKFMES